MDYSFGISLRNHIANPRDSIVYGPLHDMMYDDSSPIVFMVY